MKKTILCDWVDETQHYNIPKSKVNQISKECARFDVNFELINIVPSKHRADVIGCIGNRFDIKACENFPNIKWVQFGSVGTDKIPSEYATYRDILITNARGVFECAVARHATWLILNAFNRHLDRATPFERKQWESNNKIPVNSLTFLILGTGQIAQKLQSILSSIGLSSLLVSRRESGTASQKYISHANIHNFYNERTCIINLLPGNDNEKFVNKKYLKKFRKLYLYLNVGRLDTENHDDIVEMLRNRTIKNAAWDVIRDPKIVNRLRNEFKNRVVLTPHVASFNSNHWPDLAELTLHNINAFLKGELHNMRNRCYG
jgi:phosphoglycerate dehydrogenase-like enzyme